MTLTIGQCAKFCGVAPRTVTKWFDSGLLEGYRLPGGDRRVTKESLVKFMVDHKMPVPEGLNGDSKLEIIRKIILSDRSDRDKLKSVLLLIE